MTGGVTDKGSHSLLETVLVAMRFSTKKFALFPGLPCFLFFGVVTERKLKNRKQGRPGNEAKIVTLGDKISKKYYCRKKAINVTVTMDTGT